MMVAVGIAPIRTSCSYTPLGYSHSSILILGVKTRPEGVVFSLGIPRVGFLYCTSQECHFRRIYFSDRDVRRVLIRFFFFACRQPVNHGVPYKLTEEFATVYRLHPMLPDTVRPSVGVVSMGALSREVVAEC